MVERRLLLTVTTTDKFHCIRISVSESLSSTLTMYHSTMYMTTLVNVCHACNVESISLLRGKWSGVY